jgi:hypothetical protein
MAIPLPRAQVLSSHTPVQNWTKQSQSQSYFTTGGLSPISSSWRQAPWDKTSHFIFQLNICSFSPYVTSSLIRERVCLSQLLLVLDSAVILRSESCGTHDILLSHSRPPNLEGQVPLFIFPRNRVAWLYPQALGSFFIASYDSQGYCRSIRPRLHKGYESFSSQSQSYITTDDHSASLSWNKALFWGSRPDLYYCLRIVGLLMWGALCDERTGLSFTVATGPRHRSHFRVRVPWASWPYFTVSDSRLPFPSPPTTRRAKVEVFVPASTKGILESWIVLLCTAAYIV